MPSPSRTSRVRKRATAMEMWDSYELTTVHASPAERSLPKVVEAPIEVEDVSALFERSLQILAAESEESTPGVQQGELEAEVLSLGDSAGSEDTDSNSLPVAPIAHVGEDSLAVEEELVIPPASPIRGGQSDPSSSPPHSAPTVKASPAPIGAEIVFHADHNQKRITAVEEEDETESRMAHRAREEVGREASQPTASCPRDDTADPMEWETADPAVLELVPNPTGEVMGHSLISPPKSDGLGTNGASLAGTPTASVSHRRRIWLQHEYSPAVQAWSDECREDRRRFAEKRDREHFWQRLLDEQRVREVVLQEQRRQFINSHLLPYLRPWPARTEKWRVPGLRPSLFVLDQVGPIRRLVKCY
ncbi:hypothetical protein RUND412_001084 [Rhizina undulata]